MTQKIKVAQVITRMDRGGSSDIVRLILKYADTDLYDLKLVLGRTRDPSEETREFLDAFKERVIEIPHLIRNINPLFDLIALKELFTVFKNERFDIIHTHTAKAGFIGRIAGRLSGRSKTIYMTHGHIFYGYFNKFVSAIIVALERIAGLFTDRLIALTALEKSDFTTRRVINPSKISVIHSGLELERYRNPKEDARDLRSRFNINKFDAVVGMVGRLVHVKGPEYFIKSAKDVIKSVPNVRFLIVGDGELRDNLKSLARELNVDRSIVFIEWQEDVKDILSIMDILVVPSLNEAVGRIIIEAGACGVPAVATNVGGIPEIVKDKLTGILVPSQSPEALAEAISSLLNNKVYLDEMREALKIWIDNKFSAERMVGEIMDIYKELLA